MVGDNQYQAHQLAVSKWGNAIAGLKGWTEVDVSVNPGATGFWSPRRLPKFKEQKFSLEEKPTTLALL